MLHSTEVETRAAPLEGVGQEHSITGGRDFEMVPLGEVASVRSGFAFKSRDWVDTGVPVVKIGNVKEGNLTMEGCSFVSSATAYSASEANLRDGDILIAMTGYIGDTALVRSRHLPAALNQRVGRFSIHDRARLDNMFLFYSLRREEVREQIRGLGYGSAQPNVSPSLIYSVSIPLPPLEEQRAIARVLGALDDKIELNERMNATLDEMARALFKSWFVDFDPVRAKLEGREPYLPPEVWSLFPDRLVDSELGEIPEGWEVGAIESLCVSITSGGTPSRKNSTFWERGTISWYKTGELFDGPLIQSNEQITEAAIEQTSAKLWPAGTILVALYASPTVGRLGVLAKPGTANQAAAGLIAKPDYGIPFLRRMLIEARCALQSIAVGSAQQNINQRVLKEHRIVVPRAAIAGAYSRLMATCDSQQIRIAEEYRTLSSLRDTLLPKLMSGEVRTLVQ